VPTGGPGAGKSAVLELARLFFCRHVERLPEAAGIVFGGRFPRTGELMVRQAAQRSICHVQRELESTVVGHNAAVVVCDRGTPDGSANWEGEAWAGHPRVFQVPATDGFLRKAAQALGILWDLVPECCRSPSRPFLQSE